MRIVITFHSNKIFTFETSICKLGFDVFWLMIFLMVGRIVCSQKNYQHHSFHKCSTEDKNSTNLKPTKLLNPRIVMILIDKETDAEK